MRTSHICSGGGCVGPGPYNHVSELDRAAIHRFCCQYLQLEKQLDYPGGQVLKLPEVQDEIFGRIFAGRSHHSTPVRFQLRTLKQLVTRIQDGIGDDESDEYEVSDDLMEYLAKLMLQPLVSEVDEALCKYIVTYRLSLLQPPKMVDMLENRSLVSAGGTTGLRTWEAALHLGQYLCAKSHLIKGRRILELGAGTGYLSILCAKYLGAVHVTASDGSEEVVENLSDNFALNDLQSHCNHSRSASISPKLLKWGLSLVGTEGLQWIGGQQVDLVVGADITYDKMVIPSLVSTLRDLVELCPGTEIILAATQRNADSLSLFQDRCGRDGLDINERSYSTQDQLDILLRSGQPRALLTPCYSNQIPIRIFHISGRATISDVYHS